MSSSKRVRFATELERTPSPTFSNSSAPSSPLLRTPPTYPTHPGVASPSGPYLASPSYGRQRGHARTPSPLSLAQIHAILCSSSFDNPTGPAPFNWDVTLDTHHIRAAHPDPRSALQYALSDDALAQPAVLPNVKAIVVRCQHLPWKVDVVASNGSYVTVHDVLHSVYRNLRMAISMDEYTGVVGGDRQKQTDITRAYESRYRAMANDSAREEEKKKGLKRVDVLMKFVKFSGLSLGDRPNEFTMHLRSR
ncbi:hypothetical protein QCA50_014543 [Cerrena zonata]|uniref:DUF6699 domain-containing protein n=1 Tax=Cerrena zonata TaxID=2478898 RepID=A0AAW0FXK4_9APHY